MKRLLSNKSIRLCFGLFAFLLFTGDLVADAVHDANGVCATQSQTSGHDGCPACGCSVHTGTAINTDCDVVAINPCLRETLVVQSDLHFAAGLPAAIDHPPQLS